MQCLVNDITRTLFVRFPLPPTPLFDVAWSWCRSIRGSSRYPHSGLAFVNTLRRPVSEGSELLTSIFNTIKSQTLKTTEERRKHGHQPNIRKTSQCQPARLYHRTKQSGHYPQAMEITCDCCLWPVLSVPGLTQAQYSFTTIDVPGATRTAANGNSTHAIAGEFDDADGNTHGFVLNKGVFTTIDVPGAACPA